MMYVFSTKTNNEMIFRVESMGVVLAEIVDVIWLCLFMVDWEKGNLTPEDGVRRVVILFSLLNCIIKIPAVIILWRSALEERNATRN